jgi:cell division protein FtsQ
VNSGDVKVRLGNRSGLEEKLRRLAYILPMLDGKKGTLHLEDFSENNTDIVFNSKKKKG